MGSTRLSGKVLKKLDNNVTVLDLLIKRLKLCKKVDEIILVTLENKIKDDLRNMKFFLKVLNI